MPAGKLIAERRQRFSMTALKHDPLEVRHACALLKTLAFGFESLVSFPTAPAPGFAPRTGVFAHEAVDETVAESVLATCKAAACRPGNASPCSCWCAGCLNSMGRSEHEMPTWLVADLRVPFLGRCWAEKRNLEFDWKRATTLRWELHWCHEMRAKREHDKLEVH